jgi:adenine nucleotide transporter 17
LKENSSLWVPTKENQCLKLLEVRNSSFFFNGKLAMINEEGLSSLWKGVIPALILVSNPMIQFAVFERLKLTTEKRSNRKLSPLQFFVLGALGNK